MASTTSHELSGRFSEDEDAMRRALALAVRGIGLVEPNPPVGAVVVDAEGRLLGQGWHERFGGPHAEVHALAQAGPAARGATLLVTLEPCCHLGKTPPCTQAVISAGIARVVVAVSDPAPHNAGRGLAELSQAGLAVEVGLLEAEARRLAAPFFKRVTTGLPWVHAKWAMTLDGRIASRTGHSQWISNERSRAIVHELRGRMDAIIVGAGTVRADDPLLTARPPGLRVATRIVLDSRAALSLESRLVRSVEQGPVLVACGPDASRENALRLEAAGVEVLRLGPSRQPHSPCEPQGVPLDGRRPDVEQLLEELSRREMTNVLFEGGAAVLGACFDRSLIDELHVFLAPKLIGGAAAPGPLGGAGLAETPQRAQLREVDVSEVDGDLYIHGRIA